MKMLVRGKSVSYIGHSSSHVLFCCDFFAAAFFVVPEFPSLVMCMMHLL